MSDQRTLRSEIELFGKHARFSIEELRQIQIRMQEEKDRVRDIFQAYSNKRKDLFFQIMDERGLSWCTTAMSRLESDCRTKLMPKSALTMVVTLRNSIAQLSFPEDIRSEVLRVCPRCLDHLKSQSGSFITSPRFREGEFFFVSVVRKEGEMFVFENQFGTTILLSEGSMVFSLNSDRLVDLLKEYGEEFSLGPEPTIVRENSTGDDLFKSRHDFDDEEVRA